MSDRYERPDINPWRKRQRIGEQEWVHTGVPESSPSKLSKKSSSPEEEELDSEDFDAYTKSEIKRCEQKIRDGIAVTAFTKKLEIVQEAVKKRQAIMKQYPGLEWETIQRIGDLDAIRTHVRTKNGDPCKEIKNIEAILEAYKSKKLKWDGRATYWCQGKMLQEPAEFSMDDVKELNTDENRGDEGFWAEGIFDPIVRQSKKVMTYSSNLGIGHPGMTEIELSVRLDHRLFTAGTAKEDMPAEVEWKFLDDTGASAMAIYEDDLLELMGDEANVRHYPLRHVLGYEKFAMANNSPVINMIIAVEVNIYGKHKRQQHVLMKDQWTSVRCCVDPSNRVNGDSKPRDRLAGPFLRYNFWVGSGPGTTGNLHASTTKSGLTALLPTVDVEALPPMNFPRPTYTARWEKTTLDDGTEEYTTVSRDKQHYGNTPKSALAGDPLERRSDSDSNSNSGGVPIAVA